MKKITVTFEVEFGSEHQERSFHQLLQVMMEAIKMTMDRGHSGNKITYEIDTHDGYKIKKV